MKISRLLLICCLLLSSASQFINSASAGGSSIADKAPREQQHFLKSWETLAGIQGRKLDSERLSNPLFVVALKAKGIDPVTFFIEAIRSNDLLKEAVYHTDSSSAQAVADLKAIDLEELATEEKFVHKFTELLDTENLINVKNSMRLIILALQDFAVKKNYVNPKDDNKPNIQGRIFIAAVAAIIGHSLKRYDLQKDSKILAILQALHLGSKGIEASLQSIENDWKQPKTAIRLLIEVRAFSADICRSVPEVYKVCAENGRTAAMFFCECMERLGVDGMEIVLPK